MEVSLQALTETNQTGAVNVADNIFGTEFKPALVHQVVTAYLSSARAGTKAQKTRSQVSGGGAKPWRQKGTGRARCGTSRSPLWRSGGIIFAATPRDYSQKVNRKMYRGALRSILSELLRQGRLLVVDGLSLEVPKTKVLLGKLASLGEARIMIVTEQEDRNLLLASRNVHRLQVVSSTQIDPVSLVGADKVVVTVAALKKLEEVLA